MRLVSTVLRCGMHWLTRRPWVPCWIQKGSGCSVVHCCLMTSVCLGGFHAETTGHDAVGSVNEMVKTMEATGPAQVKLKMGQLRSDQVLGVISSWHVRKTKLALWPGCIELLTMYNCIRPHAVAHTAVRDRHLVFDTSSPDPGCLRI